MAGKPSIPKGTRDFGPVQMKERNYIFNIIEKVFNKYGYSQIETPAMENLSTLLGKYGEEGDKLLFKILNSGDAFSKVEVDKHCNAEGNINSNAIALKICEKGLRYDLTVPFARFVVQHRNDLVFPFKRYQIQPVWRADRPQKGRYREFYQCDVDVVGSYSLLNELELIQIVDDVFAGLDINVCIKINNRKVLAGLAEVSGYPEKMMDITIAIDKIDKIGLEEVKRGLLAVGISEGGIDIIEPVLLLCGTNQEKIEAMRPILASSEIGSKGLDELEELLAYINSVKINQEIEIDLSLARGLNYYTGAIFEVKSKDFSIGSICGGGRYDDLTGVFGLPNTPGVGISFGADRIYDVLKGLDKFPCDLLSSTEVLFANMGEKEIIYLLPLAMKLRLQGISTEIYPEQTKLKKQFDYADKKKVKYMVIIGEDEVNNSTLNIKNLITGEQSTINQVNIVDFFCKK